MAEREKHHHWTGETTVVRLAREAGYKFVDVLDDRWTEKGDIKLPADANVNMVLFADAFQPAFRSRSDWRRRIFQYAGLIRISSNMRAATPLNGLTPCSQFRSVPTETPMKYDNRFPGSAGKIAQQRAVEPEVAAKPFGDGEGD